MKIKTLFTSALCLTISNYALAADTPDWGNPYDSYMGQVTYTGSNGHGHSGTHGSVVSGGTLAICNQRLGAAESYHQSAGDSFVSKTYCYLKTTVLYEPQIASPNISTGNTGTKPIHYELEALEEKYDLVSYQQQLKSIMKSFDIEGFRKEFIKLHAKSITQKDEATSAERR
jgi:hypothetical protein